jgi:hypothetical protein
MMCSVNGWGVGTKLRRTNRNNDHYDMEITGLGEDAVLIKYLNYDIQGQDHGRDRRPAAPAPVPVQPTHRD